MNESASASKGVPNLCVASGNAGDSALLYARGFIMCKPGLVPAAVATWATWLVNDWSLYVDPRVPVEHAAAGAREVWVVGDAFSPVEGIYEGVARRLLEGDLQECLDRLAGRFLVISRNGPRIEIYHDAMGSRSVFYGEGVVGSHASLVAEVIGEGLRPWVIPFITSRSFVKRDVKYLPGLDSPYEGVRQLTPNCRLVLDSFRVERYWPRVELEASDPSSALDLLVCHLRGLKHYFDRSGIKSLLGMSAGRDSRGLFAALNVLKPRMFTFVRSRHGNSIESGDSRVARALAAKVGQDVEIIKMAAPAPIDASSTPFAVAFRHNTGYVRGNGSNASWIEYFLDAPADNHLFVRGFGGEVMRGFYADIDEATPATLAELYGVHAGSSISRNAFAAFLEAAGWNPNSLLGYKPSDLFYWEHRMGVWGSSALAEFDMACRCIPGYNSRELFSAFMGLPPEVVRQRLFEAAVAVISPGLIEVPFDS